MNLSLSIGRNGFHPAWLLLLAPPLLWLAAVNHEDANTVGWLLLLRLLPALLLVVPLAGWLRRTSSPLTLRLAKEFRAQLPGGLLAIAGPSLVLLYPAHEGFFIVPYVLGCLLLGATAWGAEFEQRTIGWLLAEPLPRSVLYWEKLMVMGILLALALFQTWLGWAGTKDGGGSSVAWWAVVGWPVFAFCTGPLFSLLTRSTLAGFIFIFGVPLVLYSGATLGMTLLQRMGGPGWIELTLDKVLPVGIPVYLLATAWFGWVTFRDLQVREGGGGVSQWGFHPLSLPTDSVLGRLLPAGGAGRLVRKELRLHVVPWLVAGLMVGVWLLWLAARALVTDEDLKRVLGESQGPIVLAVFLGLLTLLTAGAACVAEERQLGTLEWQLTQPTALNRQWLIKIGVAGGLALILGVGLPLGLLRLAFGAELFGRLNSPGDVLALMSYGTAALGILVMAIYASSVSRSTMKATAAAIGLTGALVGLLTFSGSVFGWMLDHGLGRLQFEADAGLLTPPSWAPTQELLEGLTVTGAFLAAGLLLAAVLWLGGRNFRGGWVSRSTVVRQMGGLALGTVGLALLLGFGLGQLMLLKQRVMVVEAEAANREHGRAALNQWFRATGNAVTPELLNSYGLPPGASSADLVDAIVGQARPGELNQIIDSLVRPSRPAPGGQFRMDPTLARRYGLIPSTPATNAAPAK